MSKKSKIKSFLVNLNKPRRSNAIVAFAIISFSIVLGPVFLTNYLTEWIVNPTVSVTGYLKSLVIGRESTKIKNNEKKETVTTNNIQPNNKVGYIPSSVNVDTSLGNYKTVLANKRYDELDGIIKAGKWTETQLRQMISLLLSHEEGTKAKIFLRTLRKKDYILTTSVTNKMFTDLCNKNELTAQTIHLLMPRNYSDNESHRILGDCVAFSIRANNDDLVISLANKAYPYQFPYTANMKLAHGIISKVKSLGNDRLYMKLWRWKLKKSGIPEYVLERAVLADTIQLIDAIATNQVEKVTQILAEGVHINIPDTEFQYPLFAAIATKNQAMVDLLFNKGAIPRMTNLQGNNALDIAMQHGMEIRDGIFYGHVEKLFVQQVVNGDLDGVKESLALGMSADYEIRNEVCSVSVLGIAAGKGYVDIVDALLSHGSSIRHVYGVCEGWGYMTQVPQEIWQDMFDVFYRHALARKELHAQLVFEAIKGDIEAAEKTVNIIIAEKGNKAEHYFTKPFQAAWVNNKQDVARMLLEKGVNANTCNFPALVEAIKSQSLEFVRLILATGTAHREPQCLSHGEEGKVPVNLIVESDNLEMKKILVQADPNLWSKMIFASIERADRAFLEYAKIKDVKVLQFTAKNFSVRRPFAVVLEEQYIPALQIVLQQSSTFETTYYMRTKKTLLLASHNKKMLYQIEKWTEAERDWIDLLHQLPIPIMLDPIDEEVMAVLTEFGLLAAMDDDKEIKYIIAEINKSDLETIYFGLKSSGSTIR